MLYDVQAAVDIREVKRTFEGYLHKNGLRRTPERIAILEEIYMRDDHFDAESLYVQLKRSNYHVSRATVYNTLEILAECHLVAKHHFGRNLTEYEKSYGIAQHDHMICTVCGKVTEFCDPRVDAIRDAVSEAYDFEIEHHELQIFGKCREGCAGDE